MHTAVKRDIVSTWFRDAVGGQWERKAQVVMDATYLRNKQHNVLRVQSWLDLDRHDR